MYNLALILTAALVIFTQQSSNINEYVFHHRDDRHGSNHCPLGIIYIFPITARSMCAYNVHTYSQSVWEKYSNSYQIQPEISQIRKPLQYVYY